jgi:prevent-host-death family protein
VVSVELKELKAHLSAYVAKAKSGEHVIITERGEQMAELVPLNLDRQAMLRLVAEGKAVWDGGKPQDLLGIHVKGKPISETVLEDRGPR